MMLRSLVSAAALVTMAAGSVLAVPAIVDRVPEGAMVVVAVPSAENLEKDLQGVATLLGLPAAAVNLDALLAQAGVTGGIAKKGAVAAFIMPPKMDAEGNPEGEPATGVVAQTSDYAAFAKNFGATPGAAGGVDAGKVQGEDVFLKNLGEGFVAIAPDKAMLEGMGKAGAIAKLKPLIGGAGDKLTDKADLSIIVNMEIARPLVKRGVMDGVGQMADQAPLPPEQLEALEGMVKWFTELTADDTSGVVMGLTIDNLGVSLDMTGNFKAGSRLGKASASPGKASAMLGKLPAIPYVAAFALDYSSAGLRELLESMPKPPAGAEAPAATAMDFRQAMKTSQGQATVVGVSPAGIMGGLLTRSVAFTAATDPAASIAETRKSMQKLADADVAVTDFKEGSVEIGGQKVSEYKVQMKPDPDNPMVAQATTMMFGLSGGPTGFVAATDGGVITTYAKATDLMEAAMKASKGDGGFTQDKVVGQVAAQLPPGRAAEVFIGVRGILDTLTPLLAMVGGGNVKLDLPETIPPIAAAISPGEGAMTATIYLPAPTLKTIADVTRAIQGAGQGDGGGPADGGQAPAGGKKPAF
jgi:hypothetical protein